MPAEHEWATDIADAVTDLRGRGGWSSSMFARSVLAIAERPGKTDVEQRRLDQYMPGWRTNADEQTLEDLRVGVGALPVLARANAAGHDVTADAHAAPLLDVLRRHADDLAHHHRAALAALMPVVGERQRKPERRTVTYSDRLVAAVTRKQAPPPRRTRRPDSSASATPGYRPNRKLDLPVPSGDHPLAGQWVHAVNALVAMDVYVVTVSEATAAVKVWIPTTGRTRLMALAEWSLTVIEDPRV